MQYNAHLGMIGGVPRQDIRQQHRAAPDCHADVQGISLMFLKLAELRIEPPAEQRNTFQIAAVKFARRRKHQRCVRAVEKPCSEFFFQPREVLAEIGL